MSIFLMLFHFSKMDEIVESTTSRNNPGLGGHWVIIELLDDCKVLLCNPKNPLNDIPGLGMPEVEEFFRCLWPMNSNQPMYTVDQTVTHLRAHASHSLR